uniref:Putative secreted peptide n=1 Tax=Anopheles braziliensis TaxID=58242 RepID=A0A2M3ZRM7_9DIPT
MVAAHTITTITSTSILLPVTEGVPCRAWRPMRRIRIRMNPLPREWPLVTDWCWPPDRHFLAACKTR